MSFSELIASIKEMWYLVALFVGVILLGVVLYFRQAPPAPPARVLTQAARDLEAAAQSGVIVEQPTPVSAGPDTRELERAKALVDENQKKFDAAPKSEAAPGYLVAMGNLTKEKLHDYKEAARLYQLVLGGYPDFPDMRTVYVQLAVCYHELGNRPDERSVYKQMFEKFPPGTQEHLFAEDQLSQ